MLKRMLAFATMVCALPALANATKVNVDIWAKSAGGIISVDNALPNPVKLTSAYGEVFGSYSTAGGAPAVVTVTPNPGFSVTGSTTCTGTVTSGYGPSTLSCADGGSVSALFTNAPLAATVAASAGPGGHANMTKLSNIFVGQKLISAVTFKFTPLAGYNVTGIAGVPAGAIVNPAGANTAGGALNQVVSVILPAGYTLTNVPVNLVASFTTTQPIANAGAPQTIVSPSSTALLNGSASVNAATYLWAQTSGPATATLASPSSVTTAVSGMTALGVYTFKLTVNGSTFKTTSITVTASAANAVLDQCVNCHAANGVGGGTAAGSVYAKWVASPHVDEVLCATCHVGANTGGHPGPTVTSATCSGCHATVTNHTAATTGSRVCLDCHDGHNPSNTSAALALGTHPPVTLYTYEEIGMQMANGQKVPVQVDGSGKGMPYSPKQTCGSTAGCHVYNGADYSYDKISDTAFHSHEGSAEVMDLNGGKLMPGLDKPWVQSTAMIGKW